MKEIHITKDTKEAGIAFVLPGEIIYGYMEQPGTKNMAIRMAVEDTMAFFVKRYAEYFAAISDVNAALSAEVPETDPIQAVPENMSAEEIERLYNL